MERVIYENVFIDGDIVICEDMFLDQDRLVVKTFLVEERVFVRTHSLLTAELLSEMYS